MRTPLQAILFAGLLLAAAPVAAQTSPQAEDPHHPGQTDPAPPADPGTPPAAGMQQGGPGMMGMMSPEMMQMMMRMMMGQSGEGAGQPSVMGGDMMADMVRGGLMMQMMGAMQTGAALHGMMAPHGLALGLPAATPDEMTPERVQAFLQEHLDRLGNPRLKLGTIAAADDGSITAEIITVNGSLVQKLAFNRYPGLVRQITE